MFNQAKFRGGYNLKFISAILFAVTFLVGGFFVASTVQAETILTLTAPLTANITRSTLVPETSGVPTGGNTVVDTAIIGLTPIAVTLSNTGDVASTNVRISPIGAGSNIQLWARDTSGNWFDINVTGWIDSTGKSIPDGSSITTNVYAISDVAGSYPLTINLVYVVGGNAATATGTVTVNAPAPVTVANVADLTQLTAALTDSTKTIINITADISGIPATLVVPVGHAVTINGGGHTLTFTGLENVVGNVDDGFMIQAPTTINNLIVDAGLVTPTTWVGTYAIQVYDTTATLNNVTATKGNGGILINGSTVTLTGVTTVSGNGFGGIEVSKDTPPNTSALTVNGTLVNGTESYGKPTIWLVNGQGSITGTNLPTTTNTTLKPDQTQYYLTAGNVAPAPLSLGMATTYAVLSNTYTNTTAGTTINGDVGFTTGPSVKPLGMQTNYGSDSPYSTAGTDQGSALSILASKACTYTFPDGAVVLSTNMTHGNDTIGVYTPGVYCTTATSAASIGSGGITLSGAGTYIFRINGAFTTDAGSSVTLNGASANDVFWTPTELTTLGANSTFKGTVIDNSGITVGSTVGWTGRALAFGGTVTTDKDTITVPGAGVDVATVSNPTITIWSENLNKSYSTYAPNTIFQANVNFDGGLTLSNFNGVVISLYNGTTLLATNTAKPALFSTYPNAVGATDLFGIGDVADIHADLNWNIGAYPSNLAPTSVVFTLTRTDGTVYTVTGSIDAASTAVLDDAAAATATALVTAKTDAHTALTTALAGYTVGNYSGANWTTLTGFKTTGDTAIDAATNLAGVSSAQNTATAGMVGVQTLAQEAATAAAAKLVADHALADPVTSQITALPLTAALVLTDKTAVDLANTAFNLLTVDQKALVTNSTLLTTDVSKIADLQAAADAAALEVTAEATAETAVHAYELAPIDTLSNVTLAEALKAPANTAVALVLNSPANIAFALRVSNRDTTISLARITLQAAADAATALSNAKTAALDALTTALGTYHQSNYTTENWTTLSGFDSAGITAINGALDLAGVDTALSTATVGMDGVSTIAETLAAYKITKLGALATAFGTYSSVNYTTENWTTLSGFDSAGITAINGALDLAGVDTALSTATTEMSGVHTIAQDADIATALALSNAKTTALATLTTALGTYTQGNYTAENWTTLTGFKTAGDTAIGVATTLEGVTSAQSAATTEMTGVHTIAQDADIAAALALSNAKTAAHLALTTARALYTDTNYTSGNLATLNGFKSSGDTAIDAATDLAGVSAAQSAATTEMTGVHTIAQDADIAAALALSNAKIAAVTELNGYKTLADYSAENQTIIGTKILTGTTAINAATTIENVATALATAKSDLDTVAIIPQHHNNSGSSTTPAVPATKIEDCKPGDKFNGTTGKSCTVKATPAVPGQVLGAEKFNFTKFLKFKAGSYKVSLQGAEVIELQKFLTTLGYDLGIADGKFGPMTEGAVIKFQISKGLKGDGIVGALTRAQLNK